MSSSRVDLLGSLKHLAARINPFSDFAWAHHRASGLYFRIQRRDVVGRHILRYQDYEPALTAWLLDLFDQHAGDALFVDVGANLGWFSLQAARHRKVGRVVALEPDVGNHALLRANIERNGMGDRIDAIVCAAGPAAGVGKLYRYKSSNLGRHSLVIDHGHGGGWVMVEALDTLLERLGIGDAPIAAIKIDVEGYEPAVFAGASRTLRNAGALIVELSRDGGLDLPAMIDAIAQMGFVPQVWDQDGPLPDIAALHAYPDQCTVGFRRNMA
ncbi:MAG: FkbM family methyltransferase [Lysobacteraceae bacterium]